MIFQHPETGLQIVVKEKKEYCEYEDLNGYHISILDQISLETEAGQPALPATESDYHDLRSVKIYTNQNDPVVLIRVD